MALQILRGNESNISSVIADDGQPIYSEDLHTLKIGNGSSTYQELLPVNNNTYSNPNMIINSFFLKPINQYKALPHTNGAQYVFDRWYGTIQTTGPEIDLTDEGLFMSGGGAESDGCSLQQLWEIGIDDGNYAFYQGKKITISLCFKGEILVGLCSQFNVTAGGDILGTSPQNEFQTKSITVTVPSDFGTHRLDRLGVYLRVVGGSGATIQWIKAELGDTATPYIPPVYIDEFNRCRRYYFKQYFRVTCRGQTTEFWEFCIPCPQLRTKGTSNVEQLNTSTVNSLSGDVNGEQGEYCFVLSANIKSPNFVVIARVTIDAEIYS